MLKAKQYTLPAGRSRYNVPVVKVSSRNVRVASYEGNDGNIGGVSVSPAFAAALQDALDRNQVKLEAGNSSADEFDWSGSRSGSRRGSPDPELSPVIEVVATALAGARQTYNRLTAERTELDSLILKEEKQVERLQFLLEKLRSDYAYFNTLERMYNEKSGGR